MYSLPKSDEFKNLRRMHGPREPEFPTSIYNALENLPVETICDICDSIFHGRDMIIRDIANATIELDLCKSHNSPLKVYLDPSCTFSILVYSSEDAEEFRKEEDKNASI